MFSTMPVLPPDPLWGLTSAFRQDARPNKIDLVVGVYRDDSGQTPVMKAVKEAEEQLAAAGISKAYRSLSGNAEFNASMARLLYGHDPARLSRQYTMQTVGGTGALRLLADFISLATPDATIWSTNPGYINHRPIMEAAGLRVAAYRWQERGGVLDTDAMLADLAQAKRGDVVLVHGCCHNPTGIDMPAEAWAAMAVLCEKQGLYPLVDLAYQGFGDGMDEDAAGLRLLIDRLDTVLVAASCSKNMGLYCERTGVASVVGPSEKALRPVAGTLERITRSNYSMPPEHGAAIATRLFANPQPWLAELEDMRLRIARIRTALGDALQRLGAPEEMQALRRQKGMFSMLPVDAAAMTRLREEFAIYGTQNGRINIAGLLPSQIQDLAVALFSVSIQSESRLAVAA
ncbi:MAG TPA: aromatic amino acid transaminase [Noviherbaspirillum sp.]|nr:aromatic amino acid transaminase [Noviherbaspirillum sp.]